MTWQQMHNMARSAYFEGVLDGIRAVKTQRQLQLTGKITDDELQWMWERSEANRLMPESTEDSPVETARKRERGFLAG
jgi:hypothetical protein